MAESWLAHIMEHKITSDLEKELQTEMLRQRRIRIAVLDTRYNSGTESFTKQRVRRLRGWKDFVQHQKTPTDDDGHGTRVLSLLIKVAPAAVFVARVTRHAGLVGSFP